MADVHIRFRHLQCFLSIAQYRAVGSAARALQMTQPALSKTLRELEEELDTRLFERARNGMVLTRTGEIFLEYAAGSLAAIRSGVTRIRAESEHSGLHVTVGGFPTAVAHLLPHAIREFKQRMPETSVRIVAGEGPHLLRLLRLGEVEFAVGRLVAPESMIELSFEELYTEPLMVVVRKDHPLTRSSRPNLARILGYPCVMPRRGIMIREEVERFLLAQGEKCPTNTVETGSVTLARNYTLITDSVWFAPNSHVAAEVEKGELVALPFGRALLSAPIGIFLRTSDNPSPVARHFITAIRQTASRGGPSGESG